MEFFVNILLSSQFDRLTSSTLPECCDHTVHDFSPAQMKNRAVSSASVKERKMVKPVCMHHCS